MKIKKVDYYVKIEYQGKNFECEIKCGSMISMS